jgi:hypothetical protein
MSVDAGKVGAVLVAGGGIAGMQAALDCANSGFKVYLLEQQPAIGGNMSRLDKTFPTNDCAVTSVNATMIYTRAIQMNPRNNRYARRVMFNRTTSVIEHAWCRMEATSALKSWTPPIKMAPMRIHANAGPHPKATPATIGPTIGPAAAIAEKCWPSRKFVCPWEHSPTVRSLS